MIDKTTLWTVIIGLGVGSFIFRFMFIGLVGNRSMPEWALRHLRYTGVAILPGLVAPLAVWPAATGGETDPARLAAAIATLSVGMLTKNVMAAVAAGAICLYGGMYLLA